MNNPILSVCIPIYNRKEYLEKILQRFVKEKSLFEDDIHLYISDNCSEEDLESICIKYKEKGLNLTYHRNTENLGMDGNFVNCFKNAKGKYLLLLGSDDVPGNDFFKMILPVLKHEEYGLVHLMDDEKKESIASEDFSSFLLDLNVWITFISSNIVSSRFIQDIDFSKYAGTMLSQVPLYMEASYKSKKNMILKGVFFQGENDSKHNSGYNLFQVFIVNLLAIIKEYVKKVAITEKEYDEFKRLLFKNLLAGEMNRRLIFRKNIRLETSGGWNLVWYYYGKCPYMYYYLVLELFKSLRRKISKVNE